MRKQKVQTAATLFLLILFSLLMFGSEIEALARVGGGQSYGGGGSSGGGGGGGGDGDGGAIIWLIFQIFRLLIYLTIEYPVIGIPLDIVFVCGVGYFFFLRSKRTREFSSGTTTLGLEPSEGPAPVHGFALLRRFDPNFSEIVFTDFCYALYAKAHDARGRGAAALDLFSPYLSDGTRAALLQRNPQGLREVKGIIVGAMSPVSVHGLETPVVRIGVVFESNYTEVVEPNGATNEMTYYVRERWELERKRDVLSPPPAQATALHCPRCGAPLQKNSVGACAFCGSKIESGEFQWYVRSINLMSKEAKGPLLTSDVPEVGTDLPSVVQAGFTNVRAEFEKHNPAFSWGEFQNRVRLVFTELQNAWSSLKWERARPHETDNIFQMHQYWIEAYKRQGLRNVLDRSAITAMQPVKISSDAFYDSITVRIWAEGYDYTVNRENKVVSGSQNSLRRFSEYWTFIRSRDAKPLAKRPELSCPNCGAPLKVNASGICEFCGGKITSGEFDWVLSRIEQDESYSG
jgi:hypothetical protein